MWSKHSAECRRPRSGRSLRLSPGLKPTAWLLDQRWEYSRFRDNWFVERILVAECKQEVSTFNPVPSGYRDFVIRRGSAIFDYHSTVRDEVGGALGVFAAGGQFQPVPTYSATAITSGGTLASEDFEGIAADFLAGVRDAGPVAGAYFALHGAMAAENEDDPEGFLLEESRKILGEDVPIVVSLDLHGVLTDRMLRHSDAIATYHTYPHVDFYETGARAAQILERILVGEARPVTARVKIPMLVRGDELITETGSFGEVIADAKDFERNPQGLSAGVMIGNPFTDVPGLRSNSLGVANGDQAQAVRCAIALASGMWKRREGMQASLTPVKQAVRIASRASGTAILMDAADATSSGASGDSTAILREVVESRFEGTVLAPVVDPPTVRSAFAAGIGGSIRTKVGGTLDRRRFRPLEIEARVRLLSDGDFKSETFGSDWRAGPTAVIESGRMVLVVTSRAVSLFDRALFHAHGQDPRRFDLVVVKSPHCEPHMYADWCGRLVNVDAPGATSANLQSLGHERCARPVFPLDDGTQFVPDVAVYQRSRYR